jgi:CzcA family heavy metal efflux pump
VISWFVSWLDTHRRSILFLFVVLAAGGIVSLTSLPIGLFPRTTFPRVVVSVDAGDRPAGRMVIEVTRPLEDAIRAVQGVRDLRSNSSRGACDISVNFDWGTNMIERTLMVEAAIARILPSLPAGTEYEVKRMDPTVFPVLGLSMRSPGRSLIELRDRALYDLRPRLSTIRGVARIDVLGGRTEEIQVLVDPEKLAASGVTLEEVVSSVSAANVVEAIGRLQQDEKLYLLLSDTQLGDLDALRKVVVQKSENGVVFLGDIAKIQSAEAPEWTKVVADGSDAVLLNVYQQPDGNTVQIHNDLLAMLAQYRAESAKDVKVTTWYDQSELVQHSVDSLRDASVIGVGLAILVLWLFLANVRVTLIASACVPLVLGMTLLVLRATGQSLDIMTLGGMAAAVGLILDDGIVMVEHGIRRLREHGAGQKRMVLQAAREMAGALTGSSLATIVVFVPLAFLGGVTGAFFKALALTIASSLAISYLFSLLAVPLLSHWMLRERDATHNDIGRGLQHVLSGYNFLLRGLLRRPAWLIVGLIPLAAIVWIAYQAVGTGFMPAMDEGGFVLDYRAPAGTSLAETDRRLRQIEKILSETKEVASYSRRTGLALGGFITEANEGDYFIKLKPLPRRPIDEVMDEIRDNVAEGVPGVEIELALLMEDLIGDLTAVPQPIEIKVFGGDPEQLRLQAERIAADIEKIPDVVDVKSGVVLAGDAVDIRVDHMKAELLGLDPEKLTGLAQVALEGNVTTHVQREEKMVGIRVWTDEPVRSRIERIQQIPLMTSDGTLVRLGRIASFEKQVGQPQITRENLKTMVAVTARISGRDMGSVMEDVKARIAKIGLPSGNYVEYGGLYKVQQESFKGLVLVTVAAALLVFTLLLYMYESLVAALSILLVSLMAAAAVFPALWWTGIELNITSMVGLTMIVGISAEASIFFMSQWQESHERLASHEALLEAGRLRLRPILMTALAAILALLPLALGLGQGSAMLQPLAVAIIAGLLFTVPAVLIALPVLVGTLMRRREPTMPSMAPAE